MRRDGVQWLVTLRRWVSRPLHSTPFSMRGGTPSLIIDGDAEPSPMSTVKHTKLTPDFDEMVVLPSRSKGERTQGLTQGSRLNRDLNMRMTMPCQPHA